MMQNLLKYKTTSRETCYSLSESNPHPHLDPRPFITTSVALTRGH